VQRAASIGFEGEVGMLLCRRSDVGFLMDHDAGHEVYLYHGQLGAWDKSFGDFAEHGEGVFLALNCIA
jgi:hypothetical protein